MKKIYTGKALEELRALPIKKKKELGVEEADKKKPVVEKPVKRVSGKRGD